MRPVLLCLHGWGGSKESFTELREALKGTDLEILTPDLPGFGDEPEPPKPWTVDDYADWVVAWTRKHAKDLKDRKLFLLGHSHGGRIAIKLACQPLNHLAISHLFLCAAAGIRRPRHFKRIIGLTLAKGGKALLSLPGMKKLQPLGKKFLYRLVRVHDYEKASPLMQQTLINVTTEDLTPLLSQIKIPTDLFWGEDDGMTPIQDGRLMHEQIKGSKLHTFKGVRHGVHRERAGEIGRVIRRILITS
jgi:pimeloyl-ACP methyl ester carboxylesterase